VTDALPRVVYIMGMARSGTTILEILLGNCPGVTNVGELTHIFAHGFVKDVDCACGQPTSRCEFWAAVRRAAGWSDDDVRRLAADTHATDWHWGFPAALLGLQRGASWRAYRGGQLRLLEAIASVSGAQVIADSSVYAARALALRRILGDRIRVVCMTRDPAGLLLSFRKRHTEEQLPKSRRQVLAYYFLVLVALRLATWRLAGTVLHVRFRDLQADPDGTLARIESWAGLDLSEARRTVREGATLAPGHIVTGNRVRKQQHIVFRGEPNPEVSSWGDRLAVGAMRAWRRVLGFA
jgi:hypothetical protein